MNKEMVEYLLLIIVLSSLILSYILYISYDDKKKIKYYKTTINYETNWDKYSDMVKEQRKIIFKKKVQLFFLSVFVFLKGLIIWK